MMKKIFYLLFFMTIFVGCSKELGMLSETSPVGGMISVSSQEALLNELQNPSINQSDAVTRAVDDVAMIYTFEAWTCGTNPRCVLHRTVTGTLTEAVFEIELIPGNYDFLFWADYGQGDYITTNLRQVSIANIPYTPHEKRDAFSCALTDVTWDGGTYFNATLKRPMAQITVNNTEIFNETQTVSIEYRGFCTQYDVLTGEVSDSHGSTILIYPNTSIGTTQVCEDFLFAPTNGQNMALTISIGNSVQNLQSLKLQANYKTQITATFD